MAEPQNRIQGKLSIPAHRAPADEGEMVTYLAGEGDPASVKWRGVEFKANAPQRIKDPSHIEAARANRFFRVGDENKETPNRPIEDAMDYRAHVVEWMRGVTTVEELVKSWAADRSLRVKCETGEDDIRFLGTLIEPKLRDMRKGEGLSDGQVAQIWVDHGILDLPWRA